MRVARTHVSKQEEVGARPHVLGFPEENRPRLDGSARHGTRAALHGLDDGGFVIHGLLTAVECGDLVRVCENVGFASVANEFPAAERNNSRVMVIDKPFALMLWDRLAPHLQLRDTLFVKPVGFGNEGVWRPTRVNECLKISKYAPGEHFAPHFDGPWVPRPDEASIFTLLLYLSTVPEGGGGETLFLDEQDTSLPPVATVRPVQGDAVVFFHDTMHSSAVLQPQAPPKYVLRTEIMFTRINPDEFPDSKLYASLPAYQRMVRVYAGSMAAFHAGDIAGFTSGYKEAIDIQRNASLRPREAQRFGARQLLLPVDVLVYILKLADVATVMRFSRASKAFREIALDGRIWRVHLHGMFGPIGKRAANATPWHALDEQPLSRLTDELNLNYFSEFRRQMGLLRNRVQTVVVDAGFDSVKLGFIVGWSADTNTFYETLVAMPNAYQFQPSFLHYRSRSNMRFGHEIDRTLPEFQVVLPEWRFSEPDILGFLLLTAEAMHTRREGAPHLCVYLEPPGGLRDPQREEMAQAINSPSAGQCGVVFVDIITMLQEHYQPDTPVVVLGLGAGTDYVAFAHNDNVRSHIVRRPARGAKEGVLRRTLRMLRRQQDERFDCAAAAAKAHEWLVETGFPPAVGVIFAGGQSVDAHIQDAFVAALQAHSAGRTAFAVLNAPNETPAERAMLPTATALHKARSLAWFQSRKVFKRY